MTERTLQPPSGRFEATATVPGDKSLSHRALIFGAMAEGVSQVIISFELEKDADVAAQEVRDRLRRQAMEVMGAFDPEEAEALRRETERIRTSWR